MIRFNTVLQSGLVVLVLSSAGCLPSPVVETTRQSAPAQSIVQAPAVADGQKPSKNSRVLQPEESGDFSFICPEEGQCTLVISGNCDKDVTLLSLPWFKAAGQLQSIPGVKDAQSRNDLEAEFRLIEKADGIDNQVKKDFFSSAVNYLHFEAPPGQLEKTLHLLKGPHKLQITNKSEFQATIETSFQDAP